MVHFFLSLFLLAALLSPLLFKIFRRYTGLFLSLIPAAFFFWGIFQLDNVGHGTAIKSALPFIPSMNIGLDVSLDGLSLIFVLIITSIGALIFIYSSPYFHGSRDLARFFPLLIFFSAAMLGLVLADDLIMLFICWELTSISSYLLIGFDHRSEEARSAAWKALLITASGGMCLLAGGLLLASASGTFAISEIVNDQVLSGHPLFIPALVLILFGVFTKSAQFPFHSWLPSAMSAPTPVSAYLHSATMVQAGIYLLLRVYPLFSGNELWTILLCTIGGISMVVAGLRAVGEKDLKLILAYATISALGLVVFLIGTGMRMALEAAITFMVLHAAYKGGLFLVAGIIDKKMHSRDIRELSGLFRLMPFTAVAALLLAASNAGLPPFLGYLGKEIIYKSTLEMQGNAWSTMVVFLANTGIVATAFLVGLHPFIGKREISAGRVKVSADFYLPPLILGLAGLLGGIFPGTFSRYMLEPVLATLTGTGVHEDLKLWHGFNTTLVVSLLTVLAGIGAYLLRDGFYKANGAMDAIKALDTDLVYERGMSMLFRFSKRLSGIIFSGYLKWYLFIAIAFLLLIIGPTAIDLPFHLSLHSDHHWFVYVVGVLAVVCAFLAIISKTIMMSLAALGGTGFAIGLIFVLLGAPDLAITQFFVETLVVILFVLVVYRLPQPKVITGKLFRYLDVILAVGAGTLVTVLILYTQGFPSKALVTDFYLENGYPLGHGKNIVNVIIANFRALDTLGETIVLATAAFGVYALLRVNARKQI